MNTQPGVYEGDIPVSIVSPKSKPLSLPATSFFGVIFQGTSYKAVAYLLMLFPISILLFTYAVTGLSLSLGLAVTIFGLPLLYGFLYTLPRTNIMQASLAHALLDVDMPRVSLPDPRGSFLERLGSLISDERVIGALLASIMILPFGILAFVFVVTSFSVSLAFMATVFYPLARSILNNSGVNYYEGEFMARVYEIIPQWAVIGTLVVVGFLMFVISLHFARYLAYAHAKVIRYICE